MSTTATTGARDLQPEMHNYVPPHYPPPMAEGHSRASSIVSKYVPDGYPTPPRIEKTESMLPTITSSRQTPPGHVGGFTPPDPDQYRPSPAALSGAVPPAQLPVFYQDNRYVASDGYDQPETHHRRSSATSRHSDRSRRSSHAHSHRESDRHRHSSDRGHDRDHQYKKSKEGTLKRQDTPRRSYGASLFALFDNVKASLKGN